MRTPRNCFYILLLSFSFVQVAAAGFFDDLANIAGQVTDGVEDVKNIGNFIGSDEDNNEPAEKAEENSTSDSDIETTNPNQVRKVKYSENRTQYTVLKDKGDGYFTQDLGTVQGFFSSVRVANSFYEQARINAERLGLESESPLSYRLSLVEGNARAKYCSGKFYHDKNYSLEQAQETDKRYKGAKVQLTGVELHSRSGVPGNTGCSFKEITVIATKEEINKKREEDLEKETIRIDKVVVTAKRLHAANVLQRVNVVDNSSFSKIEKHVLRMNCRNIQLANVPNRGDFQPGKPITVINLVVGRKQKCAADSFRLE